MKKIVAGIAGAAIVLLTLACTTGLARQKLRATGKKTSATGQVWAREEAYWRYVKAHDMKGYLSLWSESFTGWPIADDHPVSKDSLEAVVSGSGAILGHVVAYKLRRESVRQHGPVVITFYRATVTSREANGSLSATTYRMTHTWLKERGVWQIVGGMSAVDPPAKKDAMR